MESQLLKISEKYNVDIDFRIKKKSIISIIENSTELKTVKIGFLKNHIEMVEKIAKKMYEDEKKENRRIKKELQKTANNKDIFPLFSNY